MGAVEATARCMATGHSYPIRECKFCGAEIAWVKSRRTGKHYPAAVVRTPSESATRLFNLRVAPWSPHTREECEKEQARRAEYREHVEVEEGKAAGTVCAAAECRAPVSARFRTLHPRTEEPMGEPTGYCAECAEQIRHAEKKAQAQGIRMWVEVA